MTEAEITSEGFVVVRGPSGRVDAMIGHQGDKPLVAVFHPNGEPAGALYFAEDGEPVLFTVDHQGEARIALKLDSGVPIAVMFGDDAQPIQVQSAFDPALTLPNLAPSPN